MSQELFHLVVVIGLGVIVLERIMAFVRPKKNHLVVEFHHKGGVTVNVPQLAHSNGQKGHQGKKRGHQPHRGQGQRQDRTTTQRPAATPSKPSATTASGPSTQTPAATK